MAAGVKSCLLRQSQHRLEFRSNWCRSSCYFNGFFFARFSQRDKQTAPITLPLPQLSPEQINNNNNNNNVGIPS